MGGALPDKKNADNSYATKYFMLFKDIYSTILLIFCTVIVSASIFDSNTQMSKNTHPSVAYIILWLVLIWLAMVEGGQASLVGLPPIRMNLYEHSHPTAHKIMKVVNTGDNLDRYLMGRQFMVLALVFVENLAGHTSDSDKKVLGLPKFVNSIFFDTGLGIFFMTAMIGKISAQVNASRCMLDYTDNLFAYFTFQCARIIEFSGLLHCCYPVQMLFAKASGQVLESKDAPRTKGQDVFFWSRVVVSAGILVFAFCVTLSALFQGKTTMWAGVPAWLSVLLFFSFMAVVGMLEGMQIAFFAVAKMSETDRAKSPWAKRTCDLLFKGEGRNLPGFMIGRQMCVTLCFFIVARVTSVEIEDGESNIFNAPDGLQGFYNTGLLGALITTICASITWQLIASAFPMAFLSTPLTYVLLRFCLFLEWTGLCQGSWVVARVHRKLVGFKRDEVYVGSSQERAATSNEDFAPPTGIHLGPMVPQLPESFGKREITMGSIHDLEIDLKLYRDDVDKRLRLLDEKKKALEAEEKGKNVEDGTD